MKKLFNLFLLTLISIFLISCAASPEDVDKMYFYVEDNAEVDYEYYSSSYLTIIPDHERRSLDLEFKMVYENANQKNYESSAELAEPYFEEFLELSALVLEGDLENQSVNDIDEENANKNIFIVSVPFEDKVKVVKVVYDILGPGSLKEAKEEIVDAAPILFKENIETAEAEEIKAKLEEAGATVELQLFQDVESVFEITVDDKYGKRYAVNTFWNNENVKSFKSFYLELVDMLTVEAPV